MDEDEFAKTLIPELFKHNNYASFVRQLNMYGFHKKVGLSDNSMKASENKRKTPSEYWNKYFRRGRPELLWLIQKPKNPPTVKRKREEGKKDEDSDDEAKPATEAQMGPQVASGLDQDLAVIPKTELASLRNELVTLQRQQRMISTYIGQIKRQNDQLYQQATAFQALHDRHESSINAILTFLATFYNRTLEGHGNGNANLADMFSTVIGQNATQQGNIVDMGDLAGINVGLNGLQGPTPGRRRQPLALLPAPDSTPSVDTPVTVSSSAQSVRSPPNRSQQSMRQPQSRPGQTTAGSTPSQNFGAPSPATVKTDGESPAFLGDTHDIMSVINAANATTAVPAGSNLDFNSALEHYQTADGNEPLSPQRRSEVLNMIANTTTGGSSTVPANSTSNVANALTEPQPPPMPPLSQIAQTQDHLDVLQRLQEAHAAKVHGLAERLGPLSPSGEVPGFHDAVVNGATVPPPDWNLDDWIDPNSGFDWQNNNFDPNDESFTNDLDFKFDVPDDAGLPLASNAEDQDYFGDELTPTAMGGGRVESVSSRATSAAPRDDGDDQSDTDNPRKRRRTAGSK